MSKKKPKKIITNEQTNPCGCHLVTYSTGENVLSPCMAHGLASVAQSLASASQALLSASQALVGTATRLHMDATNEDVAKAARKIITP